MLKRFGTASRHGGVADATPQLATVVTGDRPASSEERSGAIIENNKVPIVYGFMVLLAAPAFFFAHQH